jgi:Glycoside hydrolase family 44
MRRAFLALAAAVIVGPTAAITAASAQTASGPALSVNPFAARHVISRDIYGMNFPPADLQAGLKLPVARWGGNATTRYNYQLDTNNRASDWYFENIPNSVADPTALPDGSTADQFIEQNRADSTGTVMTVPLIGWTPKSRTQTCGFSVAKYGPQQSTDPWDPDCGNGVKPDGSYVTGNDPTDTSAPAGADFVSGWVKYLDSKYGTAAHGGVRFYDLDNEPDIWFATHRDVHPQGPGYDEMLSKTESIAGAIKRTDPAAQTMGPVGWGWSSLFYSGLDQQTCAIQNCWSAPPDEAAHGGVPFAAWYLQQLAAYQHRTGVRLLNYFDNHWYPQEPGVASEADDPATQALRLRSTRMLWDPSYTDESWIGQPVMAIPRMKQLVAQNYPGTKVAISEYNWGALDKIDGGLAEADVLGIFGREGLDLATLWGPPNSTDPGAFAFRMYLNYDGHGSHFGGVSVSAASADQGQLSVYAAQRTCDHALTVMVINKTTGDLTSPLSITGLAPQASAHVYQYGQGDTAAIETGPDQAFSNGQATMTFPAYSITELVIPARSLSPAAAHLPRPTGAAAGTAAAAAPAVPAASGGPVSGFLRAAGYGGERIADGWNPVAAREAGER